MKRRHAAFRLAQPDVELTYPSLFQQAANAASAAGSALASMARGEPVIAPQEEQYRRMAICHACDKFDAKQGRCTLCGCYANLKTRIASEHCPLEPPKW